MGQLRALVALRWQMVRDRRVRRGLLLLAAVLPALVVVGGVGGQVARDAELSFNILLLTPSLFLGFAVLTVLAPLSSGGGNELFPSEQLVAFPMRPEAAFWGTLAAAPLNLAWSTQVVALVTATSFVADRGPGVVFAVVTALAYIAFTTAAGQALAWWVVGLRKGAPGRALARAISLVVVAGGTWVLGTGRGPALLDASPTTRVTIGAVQGSLGVYGDWSLVTGSLIAGTAIAVGLGRVTTAWALRQPREDLHELVSRRHPRRPAPRSPLVGLLRVDRSSVTRSAPLRRGLLVLAVLPGGVAALARVEWSSMALLPGLVAAGSALLFGVNAFCLDGSGGMWLASLPHSPRVSAMSKAIVIAGTCMVTVLLSVAVAATRAPALPTGAELAAAASSAVALVTLVVATCMRLSIHRPHRADLAGPRDAPAPPATMAVYSLRLALSTTFVGILFVGTAGTHRVWAGPALAGVVLLWAGHSLLRSFRAFDATGTRARVVTVVASG